MTTRPGDPTFFALGERRANRGADERQNGALDIGRDGLGVQNGHWAARRRHREDVDEVPVRSFHATTVGGDSDFDGRKAEHGAEFVRNLEGLLAQPLAKVASITAAGVADHGIVLAVGGVAVHEADAGSDHLHGVSDMGELGVGGDDSRERTRAIVGELLVGGDYDSEG